MKKIKSDPERNVLGIYESEFLVDPIETKPWDIAYRCIPLSSSTLYQNDPLLQIQN